MKTTIAVLDKWGANAVESVVSVLAKISTEGTTCFELSTPEKRVATKNTEELLAEKIDSPVAVGSASAMPQRNEIPVLKTQDAAVVFEGRIYPPPTNALAEVITAKIQFPYREAVTTFLKDVEGDFSILIAQTGQLLAARDPVGVQPLYFGENKEVVALASNRKALWKLGIDEPKSFPPGHLGTVTKNGFKFEPVQTLVYREPKSIDVEQAAEKLQMLLEDSVRMRVSGQEKVAVAFSGGLDSSVVACLAKRCGVDVELIHVSLEGQPETLEARKAADALKLPMQVHLFTETDLERVISNVVELVEEPDPIKASVGVPFYWNAQKAAEAGYQVLLAGQGADELFGGYQRYVNEYLLDGDEKVRRTMFHDVAVIHESNIERDEKICGAHDVELRLPFASVPIAKFAMSLPTALKFECTVDSLRKLVLRRTAENLGLPKSIVEKPKKAVQYSTGINNALKKLAKKQNLTLAEYINQLFLM
ncbi:MAG: asparagine synthetase B [Candidatus Bathyarchaeota archaeon]|nr:asparagine synthetase B [Candidatus Bathyarchaeota archaeon]